MSDSDGGLRMSGPSFALIHKIIHDVVINRKCNSLLISILSAFEYLYRFIMNIKLSAIENFLLFYE